MTYYEALRMLTGLEYNLEAGTGKKHLMMNKGGPIHQAIKVVLGEDLKRLGMLDSEPSHRPGLLCPVHDGLPGIRAPGVRCNGRSRFCPKGVGG